MTRQRLHGLVAILAIAGFVAGVPTALMAIGAAPWDLDLASVPDLLTRRDDGTLALLVLTLAAWIAWAVGAATLLAEIAAAVRGIHLRTIPGFAFPQHAASELVAVAALAFATAPTTIATLPAPTAQAATVTIADSHTTPPAVTPHEVPTVMPTGPARLEPMAATVDYVVKRGDSLWRIAERLLGDGTRYPEIATLNTDVLGGRPDFITPGTVLRVPDIRPAATERGAEYVVREGDTLWDIAERELGDPHRHGEIFDLSRDTVQPDGTRLTDPDLIRPGWTLTLPEPSRNVAASATPQESATASAARQQSPPAPTPRSIDQGIEHVTAQGVDTRRDQANESTADADVEPAAHAWLVPGLTAGGAVLAGCVLLTIRGHRRTQLRYRRPGQVLAPTPPELRPIEKTAIREGTTIADRLDFIDRALRHLAAAHPGTPIPITHAILGERSLTLHLAVPRELPTPWTGAETQWTIPFTTDVDDANVIPPCPLLVSVGKNDVGDLLLVNLEQFGTVAVTGNADRAEALARHVVAELALSPWSLVVQIHAVDLASELGDMVGYRIEHGSANDPEFVARLVDQVRASCVAGAGDPDPFRAVVTSPTGAFNELEALIAAPGPRLGTVLMRVRASSDESAALTVEVDTDGRLHIAALELEGVAAGLSTDEAEACAAIVEVTRETEPVPVPVFAPEADGWRSNVDQAGALREELTEPRSDGPVGNGSLLPGDTDDYVRAAATTAEDVEKLAPVVPGTVSDHVEESDPTLDADLAEWHDPRSRLPKLTLLGPVGLHVRSTKAPHSRTRPQLIEILAYIALHPEGVVSRELSAVFGRSVSRLRTDVGTLRDWLGTNPRTGEPHLPAGDASRAHRETGTAGYQVEDLLVDADLFRRLRARGQARGAHGVDDLLAALRLVTGQPFSGRREGGWNWLYDELRIHEIVASAIADTAHLVVTEAVTRGDTTTAHEAIEVARLACPFDEVSRLDQARVAVAEGDQETAEQLLDQGVFNRIDDRDGPVDAPDRTKQVYARRRGWDAGQERPTG